MNYRPSTYPKAGSGKSGEMGAAFGEPVLKNSIPTWHRFWSSVAGRSRNKLCVSQPGAK